MLYFYVDFWKIGRRNENGEMEWAGGKIKAIHKNAREIKPTKEEMQ